MAAGKPEIQFMFGNQPVSAKNAMPGVHPRINRFLGKTERDRVDRRATSGCRLSREKAMLCGMAVCLAAAFILSLMLGRCVITPRAVMKALFSGLWPVPEAGAVPIRTIVLSVRLPRVAADMLVGAALSASGAAFQGLFRNPLVSPDILGVSTGAGFGAALALLFALDPFGIQAMAFGFGMLAVLTTCFLGESRLRGGDNGTLVLILSGMIIGSIFSAGISLVKFVADPYNILPAITFWLLGGLASVSANDVAVSAIPVLVGLTVLYLRRWSLNALAFGDEEAISLGVDVKRVRLEVIAAATLMTASAVAISGVIGMVGLVVPHLVRMVTGPNYKILLPACILVGALFFSSWTIWYEFSSLWRRLWGF